MVQRLKRWMIAVSICATLAILAGCAGTTASTAKIGPAESSLVIGMTQEGMKYWMAKQQEALAQQQKQIADQSRRLDYLEARTLSSPPASQAVKAVPTPPPLKKISTSGKPPEK